MNKFLNLSLIALLLASAVAPAHAAILNAPFIPEVDSRFDKLERGIFQPGTKVLISNTAPTITSGGCTSPSVPANNGTAAFTINVGSACSGSQPLVLALPTASTGWICTGGHRTAATAGAGIVQTATSTTSVTLTNVTGGTTTAVAWTSSEVIQISCLAY